MSLSTLHCCGPSPSHCHWWQCSLIWGAHSSSRLFILFCVSSVSTRDLMYHIGFLFLSPEWRFSCTLGNSSSSMQRTEHSDVLWSHKLNSDVFLLDFVSQVGRICIDCKIRWVAHTKHTGTRTQQEGTVRVSDEFWRNFLKEQNFVMVLIVQLMCVYWGKYR